MSARARFAPAASLVSAQGWHEVGDEEDPERRPHRVRLGDLRAHADTAGERVLLLYRDVRAALAGGAYRDAVRRSTGRDLRDPDDLFPRDFRLDDVAYGLRRPEAEAVANALGARLPTEKELEVVWRRRPDLFSSLAEDAALWTASPFERFSYAHCAYDLENRWWFMDDTVRAPRTGDDSVASAFVLSGGRLRRERRRVLRDEVSRTVTPIATPVVVDEVGP